MTPALRKQPKTLPNPANHRLFHSFHSTVAKMASLEESDQQNISEEPAARKRKASPSLMENVKLAGRGIRRVVTLFTPITRLVAEYDRRHQLMIDNIISEEINSEDPRAMAAKAERDRNFRSVNELFKLIPDLIDVIESTEDTPKLQAIYRQEGANDARSSDVSRVKSTVADWLNEQIPGPRKFHRNLRNGRGIQNNITGRLLCSISLDWDNPIVREKVQNFEDQDHYFGKDFYPRCLYLGEDGDPERVEEGYLKSVLLVKTFKVMFTSPSSAADIPNDVPARLKRTDEKNEGLSPRRADVATLLNMNQVVTPRSIAYAAVQLHFALQNASEWRRIYDDFNYEEFYNFIVDYFEADQSPEARKITQELLDWWNRQVFPKAVTSRTSRPSYSATSTSISMLKRQRAEAQG